ncbi:DUF3857 domain-containing protein [Pedobacter caeni]|uniref:DUF3857 domain-containing protein n=1 Tax=Pedobacter caeni TaxID=288992 RepID=A0A1M4X2L2_9SPHI|nr:DUF3857 domain-containing protein [Pedobacter caeni]SHE87721.1 protein of unknown function [Pedobacter caeni]
MKYIYLLLLLIICSVKSSAQDFKFAGISHEDIELKNTVLDSNANAMVLREFGTARMDHDEAYGKLMIDYTYHVRIKIFNKQGFEAGNVAIPQRLYSDDEDQVLDIRAVTINYIDGQFKQSELDPKKIFKEKRNKYSGVTKFTMPNLMDGSIIEYSYRIRIPRIFNFRSWEFQSGIPKLYSEYVACIPGLYNYNVSLRGAQKLSSSNAELQKECLRLNGTPVDCSKMTYIMKNIPAFIEEDYMTAASNFKSAINFELSDYHLLNGGKKSVTKTWKDVDYELVSENSFGSQMKKKDAFKELMPEILKNTTDELSKAQAVYDFIRKNIKSNGFIGIYSETAVKKALETHVGNTGDINLSLIAALSAANLDAEAVILSTREYGEVNNLFPVITDFNYVVAKVNIGTESYLLDASTPLLPFGLLPLHCINGKGRVINLKKPSYWYDLKASQKDYTRYNFVATLTKDGKIKGELLSYSSGYAGLKKRRSILEASSIEEYVEKFDEKMTGISISKHEIQNVDSLNLPLIEKYEIEMSGYNSNSAVQVFFNPFFIDNISKNPFNLNERTYPVDLGTSRETRCSIQLRVPEDFVIADQPKDLSIGLAENGGRYLSNTSFNDHVINFNQLLQLNKPIYHPEEYLSLKEFYSRIIQTQKTNIVFKKAK